MVQDVKIKSLYKAINILECFTVKRPELGITEISEQLGLYKSTVHNIVSTFEKAGYIDKNPNNDKYKLGLKILELAHVISSNIGFREIILPHMQKISDKTNEVVYLGIPSNGEVMYLDSSHPLDSIATRSMLGEKAPMYCTSIGKAMLAFSDQSFIDAVLSIKFEKFTENTIKNPETLRIELAVIKQRGYAIDEMEHEYGIKCVGMPIKSRHGNIIAGLSVSGPSLRFSVSQIEKFAQIMQEHILIIQNHI